ncbi:MAG: ABC transporter ATP-binding protein [Clostridium sp.]|nr:ABC transporter ATP-binding protein [Clostridium sp.]
MQKVKYGNKTFLIILSFSLLISAILSGAILYAMKFITDYAVSGDVQSIINISKVLALVIILELISNLVAAKLKSLYVNKSVRELKSTYLDKLFALDVLSISERNEEEYLTHLSNDMDRYEERFYVNLIKLIRIVMQLLVSIFILATVHISLLIAAILLLVFFILIANKTSKPVEEKEQVKSSSLKLYTNYVKESLDGFIEVKQNQLIPQRKSKFEDIANKVQDNNYNLDKKTSQIDAFNSFIQMSILFTMIFGGLIIAKRINLSLGTTLIVGTAFANSTWPMQEISPLISQMRGIGAVLKDFDKTLVKKESKESKTIDSINRLDLKQLDLKYGNTTILKDVNIQINKGEKVLIIGESGAGKSTILKSIRRQLSLSKGSLKANNIPVYDIYAEDYFKEISVVDQIGFIFNGTVLENITLYKKSNEKEIRNLMMQVGLDNIDLNTHLLNNGSNISGGQRARLLLARALFSNSSLIICDEIFANLDISIGRHIELDILSLETTLINVSHILFKENISLYHSIYLVENGKVTKISEDEALRGRL